MDLHKDLSGHKNMGKTISSTSRSACSPAMLFSVCAAFLLLLVFISPGFAVQYSPIQSPVRPFGLSIVDKVQVAGSDQRSKDFQNNYLPTMRKWGTMDLTSPSFTQLTSTISIDPSKINLANAYDTRVYFIGDNTYKDNTLGFNTKGGGISSGNPKLIFPDASESTTYTIDKVTRKKVLTRTSADPLLPGDFVSLGTLSSGTQLDFFLISQRTKSITDVFSTETSLNPDGLKHALVYARPDSPYLFIGFEDLYNSSGTNRNYKDVLFAVDIGVANVAALTNMPEPSTIFVLGSFILLVVIRKYTLRPETEPEPVPERESNTD